MTDLCLVRVSKSFGVQKVIHEVDLTISGGEFIIFVGPSGCGKSTLLRMIAGLEDVTSGDLLIDGVSAVDMSPPERGVAMVFQSYALYPHMQVVENLAFPLRIAKAGKDKIAQAVQKAAAMLQLQPLLERLPRQLSGGQRQRVAIGRAVTRDPRLFLFDEPLSNLDAALRQDMRLEIARLHRKIGATTIYVTHDQVEAMTLADRIMVMQAGRVMQAGTPMELYRTPANTFVAGFIGSPSMNLVGADVIEQGAALDLAGLGRLNVPGLVDIAGANDRLTVGFRPHEADINSDGHPVTVTSIERLGHETLLSVTGTDEVPLRVSLRGDHLFELGQQVGLCIDTARLHLFGPDGHRLPDAAQGAA